ncbi:MAG: hypothetical protein RIM99_00070, partial [Cyclobacteriaceae bacterium]
MTESISTTNMKSYRKIFLSALFIFSFFIVSAQENTQALCSNGSDDDGDGLVDCFDNECTAFAACDDFFFGNSVVCFDEVDVTSFAIKLEWSSADQTATSHVSPAVGDLDSNGIPEIVTVNNLTDQVFILNGSTGATLYQANIGWDPENTPAIANVYRDEAADILITQNNGDDMKLFDHELNLIWSAKASRNDMGIAGFADFNEDGIVEIYYKNEIVNAETGAIIVTGSGDWEKDYVHGALALDIVDATDADCIAAGGDCSGLELISGNEIWAINISAGTRVLVKDMNDVLAAQGETGTYHPKYFGSWGDTNWSSVSAADYNLDGNIDILMSGALGNNYNGTTTIFFWDVANETVTTFDDPSNNFVRGPGRINIGDLDGDGFLNANFVMNQKLYSLDENFNIHWVVGIKEGSSGFTGCSLFDFDGDGTIEVVYRSEESVLILDGTDGSTRNELVCVSRTNEEYPVIADVDGDGASEICVACYFNDATPFAPYNNTQFSHIRVFGSDGEAWMPARSVWNQHGYFNVNINDDLTVPTELQNHSIEFSDGICEYSNGDVIPFPSRPLNTFLTQAPILDENGCVEFVSPDIVLEGNPITATNALCPDGEITVTFTLSNTGDTDISGTLPVSYYAGDPTQAGSVYLDTEFTTLINFEVGTEIEITQTMNGIGGNYTLFVVANDLGGTPPIAVTYDDLPNAIIPECQTGNNLGFVDITYETYKITANKLEDDRRCDLTKTPNGSATAFYFGPTPGDVETIWLENFDDRTNGVQSDSDETAWSTNGGTNSPTFYGVGTYNSSKMFQATRTGTSNGVGVVTWTSEAIDISDHTDISVTVDVFEDGDQEGGNSQWYDEIILTYEIYDNSNALIESGEFPTNGNNINDFTYVAASLTNVRPNETDTDSLLIISAAIHNTSDSEHHYIDNVHVYGTGPDIISQQTEPDGFNFHWFAAGNYTDTLYTGSTFSQMPAGNYEVISDYPDAVCTSDTVAIEILSLDDTSTPPYLVYAWIYEASPLTNCAVPDGALEAFVYTTTLDGTFPASDSNPPQDTLITTDGYTFAWRFTTDINNDTIRIGNSITDLNVGDYTVGVTEDFTGCSTTEALLVSTGVVVPDPPTIVVVDINTCGGTGTLSASVGGNTADYTFYWYDGPGVKPVADFTGPVYTVNDIGDYTVVAEDNTTKCTSLSATDTMDDTSNAPIASVSLDANNTSCVSGNGIVSADGDGAGTVTGYTFDWYKGANTLLVNELPGAAEANAFLVNDNPFELGGLTEGTYRVVVTEDATSCSDTLDVFVADIPGTLTTTPGNLIVNDINSCNTTVLGSIDASGIVPGDVTNASIGNINVSFEDFDIISASNHQQSFDGGRIKTFDQEDINGWSTTATDDRIEIWHNNNTVSGSIHDAFHGDQFAEINANETAALYFDLSTTPGALLSWSFAHKGRDGTDEISVNIGTPGAEVIQGTYMTGNTNWSFYEGTYTIPDAQFLTRFQFEAVSTAGGNTSVGNFVDTISFVLFPYRFELYEGTSTSGTADYINTTGVFTDLDNGDYVLVVYDNLTGCDATEIPFTMDRLTEQPEITTNIVHDANCDTDAGIIEVTTTMPAGVAEPSSYTYQLYQDHSFTTQIGSDVTINDGSVTHQFTGLSGNPGLNDFRIRVINNETTCEAFVDRTVNDITVDPVFVSNSTNDDTSCSGSNGSVSVAVDGNGDAAADASSGFRFTWYDGDDTSDPFVQDINGIDANGIVGLDILNSNTDYAIDAGFYTVVAEDIVSGCETVPLTLQVFALPYEPDVVIVQDASQTLCGSGDGVLRAYVTNDPDEICTECTTNFDFQWFYNGVALVEGDPLANGSTPTDVDTNILSGLAVDPLGYTVTATHKTLGCDNTENFILTESQVIPVITQNGTPTDNTSCDPASYDGSASVNVNPAGTYTYYWFYSSGTQVTDINNVSGSATANISGINGDTYKVVAESTSNCTSDTLVVVIGDQLIKPDFESSASGGNINNTVCDPALAINSGSAYNGQVQVDIVSGTLADYTIEWYIGTDTTGAADFGGNP